MLVYLRKCNLFHGFYAGWCRYRQKAAAFIVTLFNLKILNANARKKLNCFFF